MSRNRKEDVREFIRNEKYKSLQIPEAAVVAHEDLCQSPDDSAAASCLHFIAMAYPELITDEMAAQYTQCCNSESGEIIAVCQVLGLTGKRFAIPFLRTVANYKKDWMVADAGKDALDVLEGRKKIGYGNTGESFMYTIFE